MFKYNRELLEIGKETLNIFDKIEKNLNDLRNDINERQCIRNIINLGRETKCLKQ